MPRAPKPKAAPGTAALWLRRLVGRSVLRLRPPPQAKLLQIVSGFWLSRALFLAARLELADAVGDGPTPLTRIAEATGTRPEMLRRLLRALTANGIFQSLGADRYGPTPLSDLLRSDRSDSMRAFAETVLGHDHYEAWGEAEHSLRTGGTAFDHRFGMPVFRYYAEHPDAERRFDAAMTGVTRATDAAILLAFPVPDFTLAVDVGGGEGAFLRAVLARHPAARGIVFDRPGVVARGERERGHTSDAARLQAVAGDFFERVPAGGDLYLLKMILHDWGDDAAVRILRNIRRAIAPGGRVAIVEAVLPAGDDPHPATLFDLNMMVMTGGRERTEAEYRSLLEAADFRLVRVGPTLTPFSIIEAVPA